MCLSHMTMMCFHLVIGEEDIPYTGATQCYPCPPTINRINSVHVEVVTAKSENTTRILFVRLLIIV